MRGSFELDHQIDLPAHVQDKVFEDTFPFPCRGVSGAESDLVKVSGRMQPFYV